METAQALEVQVNPIFQLADKFRALKERKDELEDALKAVNAEIEQIDEQLAQEMINEENQNFSRRGKTFYLTEKLYVHSIAEKRDELHKGLKENGFADMVRETVFPSTLKGFVKEQLEENDELPEWAAECISYVKRPSVRMRKAAR
ncbi:MAG: hypothetical protein A4E55_00356 [Pelotomaculum sp. PtaU1.Bin035]|nr:MAG: hypothetical protein A4E55_00356 [Pelotomaculum sp. PtaU1.Bin035]